MLHMPDNTTHWSFAEKKFMKQSKARRKLCVNILCQKVRWGGGGKSAGSFGVKLPAVRGRE